MHSDSGMNPTDRAGSRIKKRVMDNNYIWVLTNNNGVFIKACSTRETAKKEMENWRENFVKAELWKEVSNLDAVYFDKISFKVTAYNGKVAEMTARRVVLF